MNVSMLAEAATGIARITRKKVISYPETARRGMSFSRSVLTTTKPWLLETTGTSIAKRSECRAFILGEDMAIDHSATGSYSSAREYDESDVCSWYSSGCAFGKGQDRSKYATVSLTGSKRR